MNAPEYSPRLYTFCRRTLRLFLKLYNRIEAQNIENVPKSGGTLLVANHASFLDPPALGCEIVFRPVRYMARDSLFANRWFGALLRGIAAVPISREKGDISALKKALGVLKSGDCLGFFPEGTRTTNGQMKELKAGVGFLAAKAGVPIVPAYIDGSFAAFSRHHKWIRPRKIRVIYGPAIQPSEIARFLGDTDAYERIGAFISERIRQLAPKRPLLPERN
ncbi:MAG: 1-acyl-sn-glycerol-3-phosphate acyltransferase [Kiritimatiellae bacterium]|nr:1-acyl-sn-glycerol-3-phosphate acyltransferase [Kiritimatiellia bacterium]